MEFIGTNFRSAKEDRHKVIKLFVQIETIRSLFEGESNETSADGASSFLFYGNPICSCPFALPAILYDFPCLIWQIPKKEGELARAGMYRVSESAFL